MNQTRLHRGWPTRQVDLTFSGHNLSLLIPDQAYEMLDLPSVAQACREDDYMPYWAHLWPAGLMLADWLAERVASGGRSGSDGAAGDAQDARRNAECGMRNAEFGTANSEFRHPDSEFPMPPARVLEIGCGLGVAGLLAARLGYRVTLTDYDPDALDYVRRNSRRNRLAATVAHLDWRKPLADRFAVILAADVLYEQRSHQPILELLRSSLEGSGTAVLADPGRSTADPFIRQAGQAGWQVGVQPARWQEAAGRIILLRRGC